MRNLSDYESLSIGMHDRMVRMLIILLGATATQPEYTTHKIKCIIDNAFHVTTQIKDFNLLVVRDIDAAIGTEWVWNWNTYYFAREEDATWFSLRY